MVSLTVLVAGGLAAARRWVPVLHGRNPRHRRHPGAAGTTIDIPARARGGRCAQDGGTGDTMGPRTSGIMGRTLDQDDGLGVYARNLVSELLRQDISSRYVIF